MNTKKYLCIAALFAALALVLVPLVLACGDTGRIHGTVTKSGGGALNTRNWDEAYISLEADSYYGFESYQDDVDYENGEYSYSGLWPDTYTVYAWSYTYEQQHAQVTLGPGGDVEQDFVLSPISSSTLGIDVTGLDKQNGAFTGGERWVKVKATYSDMYCHYLHRLVVWAWNADTGAIVLYDTDVSGTNLEDHLDPEVDPNTVQNTYDTTHFSRFRWNTVPLPNKDFSLYAYMRVDDPHGDGTDINPDPAIEDYVHEFGSPPDGMTNGTATGKVHTVTVKNVYISDYYAVDTPVDAAHDQDAFCFDPDGTGALSSPSFGADVEYWDTTTPIRVRLWAAPTAWGDTRPYPSDPHVDVEGYGGGITYPITWDGTWVPDPNYPMYVLTMDRGTFSFDIDAYVENYSGDHFYAKTHDGQSDHYKVRIGNHDIWWQYDPASTSTAIDFDCEYQLTTDADAPDPTSVDMIAMKDLTKIGSASHGSSAIWTDSTHTTVATHRQDKLCTVTSEDGVLGLSRVVFTGETASGADLRRDGANPRILATNADGRKALDLRFFYTSSSFIPDASLKPKEKPEWSPSEPSGYKSDNTPGAFLPVNNNDNAGGANGVADLAESSLSANDPDLRKLSIVIDSACGGNVTLTLPYCVHAWASPTKTPLPPSPGETAAQAPEGPVVWAVPDTKAAFQIDVYLEGFSPWTKGTIRVSYNNASDEIRVTTPQMDIQTVNPCMDDILEGVAPGLVLFVNNNDNDQDGVIDQDDNEFPESCGSVDDDIKTVALLGAARSIECGTVTLKLTAGADKVRVCSKRYPLDTMGCFLQGPTHTYWQWLIGPLSGTPTMFNDEIEALRDLTGSVFVEGLAEGEAELVLSYTDPYGLEVHRDTLHLTVTDVKSTTWVAMDSPLTANTNPSDGSTNGQRIFPGKTTPDDNTNRRQVTVKAKLGATAAGAVVQFRVIDVDDPSASSAPLDDESEPEDNLAEDASLLQTSAVTDAAGEAKVTFQVGWRPGDNYRVVASGSRTWLNALKAKQNTAGGEVVTEAGAAVPAAYVTDMLTVWRRLHVEKDCMSDVSNLNQVTGTVDHITGIVSDTSPVATQVYLALPNLPSGEAANLTNLPTGPDSSPNLDSIPTGFGRFRCGRIKVGTGAVTNLLLGNGNDYVKPSAGNEFNISAVASVKPGAPPPATACSGKVIELHRDTRVFTVEVTAGSLDSADYNGGTLTVAGTAMTIETVSTVADVPACRHVKVTELADIPFELNDDDTYLMAGPPNTGLVNESLKRAYIEIADDGCGNMANNTNNINPLLNWPGGNLFSDLAQMMMVGNASSISANPEEAYYAVCLCSAFQGPVLKDGDGESSIMYGASALYAAAIFQEAIDEQIRNVAAWAGKRALLEQRVVVHEIGHCFDLADAPGGSGFMATEDGTSNSVLDPTATPSFTDAEILKIRQTVGGILRSGGQ